MRIIILYIALLSVGFWGPVFILLINKDYGGMINLFINFGPMYLMFFLFFLLAFKLYLEDINVRDFFYKFRGPLDLIRLYHRHVVKGQKISILWIFFWVSFILFAITTIKLLFL